jgi:hypothetical protein
MATLDTVPNDISPIWRIEAAVQASSIREQVALKSSFSWSDASTKSARSSLYEKSAARDFVQMPEEFLRDPEDQDLCVTGSLPWAHRIRLQQLLLLLLTSNVSNKSGNLLFAQSYPEQYENVGFVHSWCTVESHHKSNRVNPSLRQRCASQLSSKALLC